MLDELVHCMGAKLLREHSWGKFESEREELQIQDALLSLKEGGEKKKKRNLQMSHPDSELDLFYSDTAYEHAYWATVTGSH